MVSFVNEQTVDSNKTYDIEEPELNKLQPPHIVIKKGKIQAKDPGFSTNYLKLKAA